MRTTSDLDQLPSIITTAKAKQLGISKHQLYTWRDEGLIEPLGRGVFIQAGTKGDPDLIEIAVRAPTATLCLSSALARHELSDEIPDSIHVAIERSKRPQHTSGPVIWHRFDEKTFAIDREGFEVTEGFTLGLYGPTRTVIDTFRLRHIEGPETAIEALRRWLKRRGNQPAKLLAMTRYFPAAEKSIRSALEVLL